MREAHKINNAHGTLVAVEMDASQKTVIRLKPQPRNLGLLESESKLHHLYILNLRILIYLRGNYDRGTRCVHEGLQTRKDSAGRYINEEEMDLVVMASRTLFKQCLKMVLRPSLSILSRDLVSTNHRWGSLLKTRQPGDRSLFRAS